ncbi:MAG TPA: RDD family protein [Planctomycetota bacterium]|nr:RDD family protein [Planctomycetota bacterium]
MDETAAQNPFAAPAAAGAYDADPGAPRYAGFWWRVLATLIDAVVLSPAIVVGILNSLWWHSALVIVPISVVTTLYKVLMEMRGGTLGKLACGIRIIDASGRPPGRAAIGRNILSLISLVVELGFFVVAPQVLVAEHGQAMDAPTVVWLGFSYLIGALWLVCILFVPFHAQKRGLHDLWSGTWCVQAGRRRS